MAVRKQRVREELGRGVRLPEPSGSSLPITPESQLR